MRSSSSLLGRGLMGIALQARHPNENLENNLQLESFSVSSVCSVDYYHRILDGIYTETKSLKKILTENALEHLAFGENIIMDRLTGSTSKRKS